MTTKRFVISGLAAVSLLAVCAIAVAGQGTRSILAHGSSKSLVDTVREATGKF